MYNFTNLLLTLGSMFLRVQHVLYCQNYIFVPSTGTQQVQKPVYNVCILVIKVSAVCAVVVEQHVVCNQTSE